MATQLMCPNLRCRKVLSVPDEARGKIVVCSHCHQALRVPASHATSTHSKPPGGHGGKRVA